MAKLINLPTENNSGVYSITNSRTNKIYVGSSLNLLTRAVVHEREIRRGQHGNKSIQQDLKENDVFVFKVLKVIDDDSCNDYYELKTKTRYEEYKAILKLREKGVDSYNRETIAVINGRLRKLQRELREIEERKQEIESILKYSDEELIQTYKHEVFKKFELKILESEILKRMKRNG